MMNAEHGSRMNGPVGTVARACVGARWFHRPGCQWPRPCAKQDFLSERTQLDFSRKRSKLLMHNRLDAKHEVVKNRRLEKRTHLRNGFALNPELHG